MPIPVPVRMELQAMACVGSVAACKDGKDKNGKPNENYVRAGVFIGFDAQQPARNYAMVMTTEMSIGKIFGTFHVPCTVCTFYHYLISGT